MQQRVQDVLIIHQNTMQAGKQSHGTPHLSGARAEGSLMVISQQYHLCEMPCKGLISAA
jgi:hypothetical protein